MAVDKAVKEFMEGTVTRKMKNSQGKMVNVKIDLSEGVKLATEDLASDAKYIVPFNCPPIDIPLGGGVPLGKVWEIFGEESHGKTTLALEITKQFCRFWEARGDQNYAVLWIESESALDKARAAFMGVPVHKFIIFETDIQEDAHDKIKNYLVRCVEKGMKLMIVHDTIAATSTRAEKEKGANAGGLMEKPRVIKSMFRDIIVELGITDSLFLVLNQVGIKLTQFNASWDSGGGKALKHFSSIRSKVTKQATDDITLPSGEKKLKNIIMDIKHVKNKMTTPGLKSFAVINVTEGLDVLDTNIRYLKLNSIIPAAAGGWSRMEIPAGFAENGKPQNMIEIKWQNMDQLESLVTEKYPHAKEWMDYLIYSSWANHDALIKAKNITVLWNLEEKFFGKRHTILSEKEIMVAKLHFKDLEIKAQEHVEQEAPKVEIPKKEVTKPAKKASKKKTSAKKMTPTQKKAAEKRAAEATQ